MADSIGAFDHKFICKAPGCTLPPTTYGGVTLHQNRSKKEHKGYGIGVARTGGQIQTAEPEVVEDEPVLDDKENRDDSVIAERLEVSSPTSKVTGSPAVPRRSTTTESVRILGPTPEPTYIRVHLKLPASMYTWFDWYKSKGYEGDFADLIAEIFFQYHLVASREYCTECGAAVDHCPSCNQELPGLEMAVVTAGV